MAVNAINGTALVLENRLGLSKSPYVNSHKTNPIAWQPWGDEALALAKKHNRLIFLSIGYYACHWCHVMEQESFMNDEIANLLNNNFIPIKVDREERPDLDALYMNYVEATTGTGGWPLNVFLTPDLQQPVFGGTYFPGPNKSRSVSEDADVPVNLLEVLQKMVSVWSTQEQKCRESAKEATIQLKDRAEEGVHGASKDDAGNLPDLDLLEEAMRVLKHSYDEKNGGFSAAPKFPVPAIIQFLLNLGQWQYPVKDIVGQSSVTAVSMALATLRQIARGAIRDQIGFGIFRYSVTADWSLPHFEKLLVDQALLLETFLDSFLLTHDAEMLAVVYDLATYILSIRRPEGGICSSEDADSAPSATDKEEREGAFYLWTDKTLKSVLGPDKNDIVSRFYGVKANGNIPRQFDPHDDFLNQNVLSIVSTPANISTELGVPEAEVVSTLRDARTTLREHRAKDRPRPRLDDKVIAAWNGLAIAALARASAALTSVDHEASISWLNAALAAANFVKDHMYTLEDSGKRTLWRIWRDGRGETEGLADDYAGMIKAALELYGATFEIKWLQWADELMRIQISKFSAENGGFYSSLKGEAKGGQHRKLLLRLKSGMDGVERSVNSQSAINLVRLSSLLDDKEYERLARRTIAAFDPEIEQFPASFPGLLQATAWLAVGPKCVVLEGPDSSKGNSITLSDALAKIRAQTGVGRTALRLGNPQDEGEQWLRSRRTATFKVLVYDRNRYKVVKNTKDLG